jgi:hypothetical protein
MKEGKKSTNLKDYIKVYKNVVTKEFCKLILDEYANTEEWKPALIENGLDTNIRNCDKINISAPDTISRNSISRKNLDEMAFNVYSKILKMYNEEFPKCVPSSDRGYQLLRYSEGGFYKEHTDSFVLEQRTISCSIILNDDFEGGEFSFFNGTKIIKPKKYSAIVFPSNFMYPHEVMEVKKNTRYSLVTWFV